MKARWFWWCLLLAIMLFWNWCLAAFASQNGGDPANWINWNLVIKSALFSAVILYFFAVANLAL